jgi:NAD(P)-dependent dehydrogenase (short-subunit alcohol dehydrogenase family)
MFRLDGKTALVTGAGSGIGLAIARVFKAQGATVVGLDRDQAALDKLSQELSIVSLLADVSDFAAIEQAVRTTVDQTGGLHILVNNAGIAHVGRLDNTSPKDFDQVFRVNVQGVFACAQACVRHMQTAGGGVILNMASIAALVGLEDRFAYSMSKGAVLSMTRSIAVDYMKHNIRCNCVCPARIHTPFVDAFIAKNYPGREQEMFEKLSQSQPIGRMGTPEEVAQLALYLCSDEASFVTGAAYPIDGAFSAV